LVAQFNQAKTAATLQVQASFDMELNHKQAENAMLGANGRTIHAVDSLRGQCKTSFQLQNVECP